MSVLQDLVARFHGFEEENALFALTCRGVPFWDYIRYFVFERIQAAQDINGGSQAYWRESVAPKALRELPAAVSHLLRSSEIKRAPERRYDLVMFDVDKRVQIDGHRANRISYPAVKALARRYSILLLDPSRFSDFDPTAYPCDALSIRGDYLMSRVEALGLQLSREDKDSIEALRGLLRSSFSTDLDFETILRNKFFYQLRMTERTLTRIGPRAPSAVIFQNDGTRIAAQCAHRLGIPSIELQHGGTSPLDLLTGYAPARTQKIPTTPDYILTFGSYWNDQFRSPSTKIAVGYPFFEEAVRKLAGREIRREAKSIVGISVNDISLTRCLYEFARRRPDYTVYYKLRPEEYGGWKAFYPAEMRELKNLVFIDNDSVPLNEYLMRAQYVVSPSSTAIYEALHLGARALIHQGWFHEITQDLIDRGWALPVLNAEDIDSAILKNPAAKVPERDVFYKPGGPENIEKAVDQILAKAGDGA